MLLSSQWLITVIHSYRDFQPMLLGNCSRHNMLPQEFFPEGDYWNTLHQFEISELINEETPC